MKLKLFILLSLLATLVNAAEKIPSHCKPLKVKDPLLLSVSKAQLILIHNVSDNDIWITHPVADPGADAGWSSRLEGGHWSALSLDKKSFELSCVESKPGHEQQLPCQGVIALCKWSKATFPRKKTGSYWAAENESLDELIPHLKSRGFRLPGSS